MEREALRVDSGGRLSRRPHPIALGSALTHPHLTTDYSEALLEFVTPPYATNAETLGFLTDLHAFVHERIADELLWPASMPCVLRADESIPIAQYGTSNEGLFRTVYRRGLGVRYGRAMQAIAGAHFNYSPPADFWAPFREHCASELAAIDFKSAMLMGLVRNYRRHAWLVVYLCGSSPALCKSFLPSGHDRLEDLGGRTWIAPHGTSLRMSDLGYRNSTQARLSISANSMEDYLAGLKAAVTTVDPKYEAIGVLADDGEYQQLNANILQIENEYYSSIRPKGGDRRLRSLKALRRNGVEYVEVRTLDLSAEQPIGVDSDQIRLVETLLLYCLLTESPPITQAEQDEIDARELLVAWEGRRPGLEVPSGGSERKLRDAGLEVVSRLAALAEILDGDDDGYAHAVALAREALRDPDATPSARLLGTLRGANASFFEYGLEQAVRQRRYFQARAPDPVSRASMIETVERSLAEVAALEAAPQPPFEDYLRAYLDA